MKKMISIVLVAILILTAVPVAFIRDAHAATELKVTGGSYLYDGIEHKVIAEVVDGTGYTIEYSTDGGATWTTDVPGLKEAGKITVHVRAIKDSSILTHAPVELEVLKNPPTGSKAVISAHDSYHTAPIRESASSSSEKLGVIAEGETCIIVGSSGEWYQIKYGDITGFVYYWFVKVTSLPSEETPDPSAKLVASGGTFVYDGKEHKVKAELIDGGGYTIEYSVDGGKTWSKVVPGLTEIGKLTVKVRATSSSIVLLHDDVIIQVLASIPEGTPLNVRAYNGTTKAPIRAKANSSSTKLGSIPAGDTCFYLGKSGDWYKVKYGDIEGFIYYWFVDEIEFKPGITSHPSNETVAVDKQVTFKVVANGAGELGFQWQYQKSDETTWTNVSSGGTSATYTVTAAASDNGCKYRCAVTNLNGTVYSNPATLTVVSSKPTIVDQPVDVTVSVGAKATFKVKASGEAMGYQWYYRASSSDPWKPSSVIKDTYTVTTKALHNGYQYRCQVINICGDVYTDIATLSVITAPVIETQPTDVTVNCGAKATFKVVANGKGLSYQWYYRSSSSAAWKKSSVKKDTYVVTTKALHEGYQYRCLVKNAYGQVYSDTVNLSVVVTPPTITNQPQDTTVNVGSKATFTVKATGDDLSYQWYYRSSSSEPWKKSSVTKSTYTVTTKTIHNGYQYRCYVSNSAGDEYSNEATLTVITAPVITVQPTDTTVTLGNEATFKVSAKGPGLTYQWYYRSSSSEQWKKSSVTKATYSVTTKAIHDGYQYRCLVKNAYGQEYTNTITLTVN